MKSYVAPPPNLRTLEQHFDELVYSWSLRWHGLTSIEWRFHELNQLENRARAHLEALTLAGVAAGSLVKQSLDQQDEHEIAAALFVYASLCDTASIVEALRLADESTLDGFMRSLPFCQPYVELISAFQALCQDQCPFARALAHFALARHDQIVMADWGRELDAAGSPGERVLWLNTAAAANAPDEVLKTYRDDPEPSVRLAALWLLATRGHGDLLEWCRARAFGAGPDRVDAIRYLGILGPTTEARSLAELFAHGVETKATLEALGITGLPEVVPLLLEALGDEANSLVAYRSLHRITGWGEMPGTRKSNPPEGMSDVELEFWEPETLPDVELVRQRWKREQHQFRPGLPYQFGLVVADPTVLGQDLPLAVFRDLFLRFRRAQPNLLPGFDPDQWVWRQRTLLGALPLAGDAHQIGEN